MSETNKSAPEMGPDTWSADGPGSENEMSFLDYLIILAKRKYLIIGITFGTVLCTAVYSLFLPNIYKATTTILPPQQSNSTIAAQLTGQLGVFAGLPGVSGIKNPNELYIGMLKSRTIYDQIIERFALVKLYNVKYLEDARSRLNRSVQIIGGKDGIIRISVEDKDPKLATELARAFVEGLKRLNQSFAVTGAAQKRLFFQEQMKAAGNALVGIENEMRRFQEKSGVIKVDDQAKVVINSIADLRARIASKNIEMKVMNTYASSCNPDLLRVEEECKGLKDELAKMEVNVGKTPNCLIPTTQIPALGTEYLRKVREVKYNETLYELLAKQYEAARLEEANDTSFIQVLDVARIPDRQEHPKRLKMILLSILCGFIASALAAFLAEYIQKTANEEHGRILMLKKYLFPKGEVN